MNNIRVEHMNIDIDLPHITCIVGPANSGKTYFLKKLCNRIQNDDIYIDNVNIKEYDIQFLKSNIAVVLNDNIYNKEHVIEELYYYLEKLGYESDVIIKKIEEFVSIFGLDNIAKKRIDILKLSDKAFIKILSLLIIQPKVIAIDNLISYLDTTKKNKLIKYIKKNNIKLLNVTYDPEDILISDQIVVLNDNKAVLTSSVKRFIKQENSILPYLGLKLPFIIELSQNLVLYGVTKKNYTDNRKLVDKLWN